MFRHHQPQTNTGTRVSCTSLLLPSSPLKRRQRPPLLTTMASTTTAAITTIPYDNFKTTRWLPLTKRLETRLPLVCFFSSDHFKSTNNYYLLIDYTATMVTFTTVAPAIYDHAAKRVNRARTLFEVIFFYSLLTIIYF
jgi:hypothetical protein